MEVPPSIGSAMNEVLMWWIDDETDRLTLSARRAIAHPPQPELKRRKATLRLWKVRTEEEIRQVILTITDMKKRKVRLPDVVVVDQRLDVRSERDIIQRGSTVAVAIRAQTPSIPLVGVSGANPAEFSLLQIEQFVDVLSRDAINRGDCIPDLYAIADGFSVLRKSQKPSWRVDKRALIRLLRVPAEDEEMLYSCLPGEFKRIWDPETPHAFARWVLHTLMSRPGFLYDDLELATLLGLRLAGLERIHPHFSACEYKGVFNCVSRRRWWVSRVRSEARRLTGASFSIPIWQIGRELVGRRRQALFSKSYGRDDKKYVPDVVAYQDDRCDPRRRVQADARDTKVLETDSPPIGFEQRRVYSSR
jgi:hypothetical protein